MNLNLNISVDAKKLAREMSNSDLLEFIEEIDLAVGETDFTVALIKSRIHSLLRDGETVEGLKKELFP